MGELRVRGGELDGLELHYLVHGHGPVTLLIHGLGGFAESWRHTVAGVGAHGTVIALDLPGFGRSSKPRRAYRLSFLARAVDELLRGLGVERASLVGHSLGGAVAVAYALQHADRVDRLVLISAVTPGIPLRTSLIYRALTLLGLGELGARLVTPAVCAFALRRCFAVPNPAEVSFLVSHQHAARTSPGGRAAYLSTLRSVRRELIRSGPAYRAALDGLAAPVLLIHGLQDRVIPVSHARAATEALPSARSRWIDRCGHLPQIEHAEAVNRWLVEFLRAPAGSR